MPFIGPHIAARTRSRRLSHAIRSDILFPSGKMSTESDQAPAVYVRGSGQIQSQSFGANCG